MRHDKCCANKDMFDVNTPIINLFAFFLDFYSNHEKFKKIEEKYNT